MTSTIETGHAKNVANLDELVSFALGYGTAYNPSRKSIKTEALQTISNNAKNAITVVNVALPAYSNSVAAREAAFEPLSKLVTRIMNALKATDTTIQEDESARTLVRKIQGTRATPKKTDEVKKALVAEGKEIIEISASQMGYNSRLENFDKLIKLLASIPFYAPNEEVLKVEALTNLYSDLKSKNIAVLTAIAPLSNARISRNAILYETNTGLVDTALDAKAYIKSLYGATSPQNKQISSLVFTSVKA